MSVISKLRTVSAPVKASGAYTVCSIIQNCISIITLPLFTRLLTTEQYGLSTIYNSWLALLTIFLTIKLASGTFQTAMVKFQDDRSGYISSVQTICLLLSGLFVLIYLPFSGFFDRIFEMPSFLIFLMVGEILATTSTQFWMNRQRYEYKYKGVIGVTLLIAVLAPTVSLIFVVCFEDKGIAKIVGASVVRIAVGIFFFFLNYVKGKKLYKNIFWKFAFSFNIPLVIYYISQMIFAQSDRIMIGDMLGLSDAALYGLAYSLGSLAGIVINAINDSYMPWLYNKIRENKESDNETLSNAIAGIIGVLANILIWFAPEAIWIFAGSQYIDSVPIIYPIALTQLVVFLGQLSVNIEFYYEHKFMLVVSSVIAAVMNIVLNIITLPVYGFVAAGYTTLISYAIMAILNYPVLRLLMKKNNLSKKIYNWRNLIIILAITASAGILGVFLYSMFLVRLLIWLIALIIIFCFRKRIVKLIAPLMKRT